MKVQRKEKELSKQGTICKTQWASQFKSWREWRPEEVESVEKNWWGPTRNIFCC